MTSNSDGSNAQCHRIPRCKCFCCFKASCDKFTIFVHEDGQFISGWIICADMRRAGDDNNIASSAIAIEVEGYPGVMLQMFEAFGACQAINEKG